MEHTIYTILTLYDQQNNTKYELHVPFHQYTKINLAIARRLDLKHFSWNFSRKKEGVQEESL